MEHEDIMELARSGASPAVSVLLPVEQPVRTHPETALRLRALVDEAVDSTSTWWGAEAAALVRAQFDAADVRIEAGETARGLALFVCPEDRLVLRLPFPVVEEVIVDTTYATRQLLEGWARQVRYRVVVLDGTGARLFEGVDEHLEESVLHGFPVHVDRPKEQDTPHHDLPRRESVPEEDRKVVARAVVDALTRAHDADPRPVVVVGTERRVAAVGQLLDLGEQLVGVVHGDHVRDRPDQLWTSARPLLHGWRTARREAACRRLREAAGVGRAVTTFPAVDAAVAEGRGRELIVEEGFAMPRRWLDGLAPGDDPDPQLDTEDMVDDAIERVLLMGGEVTFVDPGSLDDCGQIGLVLRW